MLRGTTALVCLLFLASGCGSNGSGTPGASDHSQSPSAEQAQQLLTEAVATVANEDVTGFHAEISLNSYPLLTTEGVARAGAWTATTTISDPGAEDRVMRSRSVKDRVWMQMADWPSDQAKCWLQMSPTQVPLGVTALTPGEPAYLSALHALTATGFGGDPSGHSLLASIDLRAAFFLLPGKLLQAIDLDARAAQGAESDIVVGVADGRVHDLRLSGISVLKALTEAGATVTQDVETALEALSVVVEYPTGAVAPAIEPPAESLILQAGDQGFQGCGA